MNKVDFPIGVELPLTGGGIAVLLEFAWGHWWGRYRETDQTDWVASKWYADGSHAFAYGDLDIRQSNREEKTCEKSGSCVNKINFPTGVELPLRGGGVAVLYEFFEGRWWGRFYDTPYKTWRWLLWGPNGEGTAREADILPPKRKAWVCWTPNDGATLFKDELVVMAVKANSPEFQWQEITEP